MESTIIRIAEGIKTRAEHFGGILFNTVSGDVIEVDREAYALISIIKECEAVDIKSLLAETMRFNGRKIFKDKAERLIHQLVLEGIITYLPNGVLTDNQQEKFWEVSQQRIKWPVSQHLSAPESVHWAVTYRCDKECPDCYVERHKSSFLKEVSLVEAYKLIDDFAAMGVFQLSIGGGEPFMRDDLEQIVQYAYRKGLIVHLTTGKHQLEKTRLDSLSHYVKTIQFGINTEEFFVGYPFIAENVKELISQLHDLNIVVGANLVMTRNTINNFKKLLKLLTECGFKRFTLLRYKPPADINRWLAEKPDIDQLRRFDETLQEVQQKYSEMDIRIDCAFSFLERNLEPHIALAEGIRGCVAAERIISVSPDGTVFPCSQLVGDRFRAGNLFEEDWQTIWSQSKILKKYRNFRRKKSFLKASCGKCPAKVFCGGCRVFADNAYGTDPGCFEYSFENEFMFEGDIIAEIQDSIGRTSAGVPFATREEIKRWIQEEDTKQYPEWVNINNVRRRLL